MTRLATIALWSALVANVTAAVAQALVGRYGSAALQLVVVAGLAGWLRMAPLIHRRLEAQLAQALAEREMKRIALEVMQSERTAGRVQVRVFDAAPRSPRVN